MMTVCAKSVQVDAMRAMIVCRRGPVGLVARPLLYLEHGRQEKRSANRIDFIAVVVGWVSPKVYGKPMAYLCICIRTIQ